MQTFKVPIDIFEAICIHAQHSLPEEACGLIAGLLNRAEKFVAVTNVLHSPTAYQMDAREQITAFQQIESAGLELIGIVHSHPNGPARPSLTDIKMVAYTEVANFILSRVNGQWNLHAFSIDETGVEEIQILWLNTYPQPNNSARN